MREATITTTRPAEAKAKRRAAERGALSELQGAAGNRAMESLIRSGVVGAPGDALERAANGDGAGTASGQARAEDMRRRSELTRLLLSASPGRALPGWPDVHVHTDAPAAKAANALGARAFTVGRDIAFADGEFAPSTVGGRRLIDHELTHVHQQAKGRAPVIQRAEAPPEAPLASFAEAETLDNAGLVAETARVNTWLGSHSEVLRERAAYKAYQDRLMKERGRRILGGHVWLLEAETAMPPVVFRLVPMSATKVVVVAISATELAKAAPTQPGEILLTDHQLAQRLRQQSIPKVPAEGVEGAAATGAPRFGAQVTPFQRGLPSVFTGEATTAGRYTNLQHLRTALPGVLGEMSTATRTPSSLWGYLGMQDLNAVPWGPQAAVGNFPIFDWRSRLVERLYSVKASAQVAQSGRLNYYEGGGVPDVTLSGTQARQTLFGTAAQTLHPGQPQAAAMATALERAMLAVNADDVGALRESLREWIQANPDDFANDINRLLRNDPARSGSQTFSTLADVNKAVQANQLTVAEFDALKARWGNEVGAKITSHGTTTAEIRQLLVLRTRFGLGAGAPTPQQLRGVITPEWLAGEMHGGGFRGRGRAAIGGAPVAGLIGVAMGAGGELVAIYFNPEKGGDDPFERVVIGGGMGATSSVIGGMTEHMVTGAMTEAMMPSTAAIAAGTRTTPFVRGVGGGVGGAIAAPVFVVGMMAFEERDYEAYEYIAKGGRATFAGGVSGALGGVAGAAATGAIGGSWGGPIGIVVGVIVGVGAYYLIDTAVGQAIEESIQEHFHPSVADPEGAWGPWLRTLSFIGSRMHD